MQSSYQHDARCRPGVPFPSARRSPTSVYFAPLFRSSLCLSLFYFALQSTRRSSIHPSLFKPPVALQSTRRSSWCFLRRSHRTSSRARMFWPIWSTCGGSGCRHAPCVNKSHSSIVHTLARSLARTHARTHTSTQKYIFSITRARIHKPRVEL